MSILAVNTDLGLPENIPGVLYLPETAGVADGFFNIDDGANVWKRRQMDAGHFFLSWIGYTAAPSDKTSLINSILADSRVKVFVVDVNLTLTADVTVPNGKKVVVFPGCTVTGGDLLGPESRYPTVRKYKATADFSGLVGDGGGRQDTEGFIVTRIVIKSTANITNLIIGTSGGGSDILPGSPVTAGTPLVVSLGKYFNGATIYFGNITGAGASVTAYIYYE